MDVYTFKNGILPFYGVDEDAEEKWKVEEEPHFCEVNLPFYTPSSFFGSDETLCHFLSSFF